MNTNMRGLKEKGFVAFPYPHELKDHIKECIELWQKFCSLPSEIRQSLPYSNNSAGIGYEFKNGVGLKADRKENFDLTGESFKWFKNNIREIHNPVILEFLVNAIYLLNILEPVILQFAEKIETEFNFPGFLREVSESRNNFFVRFIHYFDQSELNQEIATAHTDQSGFTFHLFESNPGLQCLTYDGQWINMPVSDKESVVIPAMQLQLRSDGILRALCHRVVADEETVKNGRYSAVCFIQLKNFPKYNKDVCGRLQEKTPGFNYSMSKEEFQKMFK